MVSDHTTPAAGHAAEHARARALAELRAARDVMGRWTDLIRQQAEARVSGAEVDDVLTDPAYSSAIELYAEVNDAIAGFALHGDRLPEGGRS